MSTPAPRTPPRSLVLTSLALLYTAQGIPFGIANDYLVVALRRAHHSRFLVANTSWLQLPWQLKLLWAHLPDRPSIAVHARRILLVLQIGLAALTAAYACFSLSSGVAPWFVLTVFVALFAATQDVFVDALAVRTLSEQDRGLGNTAQVGGYRLGMLLGGAGLLTFSSWLGVPGTFLLCAGILLATSMGAFVLRTPSVDPETRTRVRERSLREELREVGTLLREMIAPRARIVLLVALTYKLGIHMASTLLKHVLVDAHWSDESIGLVVIVIGSIASVAGSLAGGVFHRRLGETSSLVVGVAGHVVGCLLLVGVAIAPQIRWLAASLIAVEHLVGAFGTTVLFAALMTATQHARAGLHYTLLSSANNISLAMGGIVGSALADTLSHVMHDRRAGEIPTFVTAALCSLLPLLWLSKWQEAAFASSRNASVTTESG